MEAPVEVRPGLVTSAIRRRWLLIALGGLLGLLAGLTASLLQPVTYTSTATVFLNPLDGNPFSPTTSTARNDQLASLETEAALVTTDVVASAAREAAKGTLPDRAASRVNVTVPSNSQVLRITYSAGTGESARQGAQAFADAYLAHRQEQAKRAVAAQAERLNAQIAATTADLDAATARLGAAEQSSAAALLGQQQVQVYASQLAQLRIELSGANSASTAPGEVITPAAAPSSPGGLPRLVLLLGGLLVGVLLGVIVAVAREHSDDRIMDVGDVEALGAVDVLGVVRDTGDRGPPGSDEAIRVLRSAVLAGVSDGPFTLTVAAAAPGQSPSSAVALALSRSLARIGRRVVLVVADGAGDVNLPNTDTAGLSELLRAETSAAAALLPTTMSAMEPRLTVIGPGANHKDDGDLFETRSLRELLSRLHQLEDVVVVAAPPLVRSEGLSLAVAGDATLVIATAARTRHGEVLSAVDELDRRNVSVLGIVLVRQSRPQLPKLLERPRRGPTIATDVRPAPMLLERREIAIGGNGSGTAAGSSSHSQSSDHAQSSDTGVSRGELRSVLDELQRNGVEIVTVASDHGDEARAS